jgi:hypothetical protein
MGLIKSAFFRATSGQGVAERVFVCGSECDDCTPTYTLIWGQLAGEKLKDLQIYEETI